MNAIRNNIIRVNEKEVKEFSPLAEPILRHVSRFAALPLSIEKTVMSLIKDRLENGRHRLVCMSCGKWESVIRAKDVKDSIICPVCRSHLVSDTYSSDNELISLVRKKKEGMNPMFFCGGSRITIISKP